MASASPVQLVDADGEFGSKIMDEFAASCGLLSAGLKYQIVAIMGPQSSGKSTLMNHVFGSSFQEMDATLGRRQTTRGIWLSRAAEKADVLTMLLDLEGTDGRERGEDDTTFERQSALFALAVADVVLINIWCHDIGREHGSGKPLIKTILQVNLKLFTPSPSQKKTVLVFIIRDKSRTPLEKLAEVLEQDMLRIWESIIKPAEYQESSFHDFFEVFFEALPNYEEKEDDFNFEAKNLKKKFGPEAEGTYVRTNGKLPGDAIPLSTCKVWEVIKTHKDLDLPAHKAHVCCLVFSKGGIIMVATTRCSQIQHDQLEGLKTDGLFETLLKDAAEKLHEDFGERMSSLVDSCITGYDEDTMYFDAEIRADKRVELVEKVTALVKKPFEQQMLYLHASLFSQMEKDLKVGTAVEGKGFSSCAAECKKAAETAFVEKQKLLKIQPLEIEADVFLKQFKEAVDCLIAKLKRQKIEGVMLEVEKLFATVLSAPMIDLLDSAPCNLWNEARSILSSSMSAADRLKTKELEGYHLSDAEWEELANGLKIAALKLMKVHTQEAANTVLSRMKDRFSNDFSLDENKMPRTWTAKDNIAKISKSARLASANVLAQLTIFQAEGTSQAATDIEDAIRVMAKKDFEQQQPEEGSSGSKKNGAVDIHVAVEWTNVHPDQVLIQPAAVRSAWKHFMTDTKLQITQATLTQHANKLASNRMPPIWAIIAMLFLGFNEFMSVVYSPILALGLILLLLFIRSLYIEMDVDNEMQKGALPGAIALAGKFVPSVRSVSNKTLDSALQLFQQPGAEGPSQQGDTSPSYGPSTSQQPGLRQRTVAAERVDEPSGEAAESRHPAPESAKDK